jgi:hypothetical protein
MAARRRWVGIALLLLVLAASLLLIAFSPNLQALGLSGFGLLAVLVVFRIAASALEGSANRQFKAERRAVRGARAEEKIEDTLTELGDDFYILHDIPSPYGNIDHIVLGRQNGVFLLETKAHGGKVEVVENRLLVNGKPPEKDFIAQALKNTYWLKGELKKIAGAEVWVTPVVVFANAFVPQSKPVKGVVIINKRYLASALRRGRPGTSTAHVWDKRGEVEAVLMHNGRN